MTRLLALALLVQLTVACGSDASAVSLADLATHEGRYEGDTVAVTGHVRPFADEGGPTYYVLEDAASNRVMLLPAEAAAPHDGATVCVTGKFAFEEGRGRTLTVDSIEDASAAECEP
jgi:hypothetical protein